MWIKRSLAKKLREASKAPQYLVYGGSDDQRWPQAQVLGWQSAGNLIEKL